MSYFNFRNFYIQVRITGSNNKQNYFYRELSYNNNILTQSSYILFSSSSINDSATNFDELLINNGLDVVRNGVIPALQNLGATNIEVNEAPINTTYVNNSVHIYNNRDLFFFLSFQLPINGEYSSIFTEISSNLLNLLFSLQSIQQSLQYLRTDTNVISNCLKNDNLTIAKILQDKVFNVDMSGSDLQIDTTDIVSAINNINNQDLVDELEAIFFTKHTDGKNYNIISGFDKGRVSNDAGVRALVPTIQFLRSVFTLSNPKYAFSANNDKILFYLASLNSAGNSGDTSSLQNSSYLKIISDKLQNIEQKLEDNLPFTTIVENETVEANISKNCNYNTKIENIPFS